MIIFLQIMVCIWIIFTVVAIIGCIDAVSNKYFTGLDYVFGMAETDQISVYIPKGLGCGLAGGNWDFVEAYIRDLDYMFKSKVNITIVEKEMQ